MPIYEYECDNCGHTMEKIQRMSDDPLKDCPECEASSLRKLVSAAAFKLKGTGWYETDFKDKKSEGKNTGQETAKGKDGKDAGKPASEKKGETKKEAGNEAKKVNKKGSGKDAKPKPATKAK